MKDWKGPVYLFLGFTLAGTSAVTARFASNKLGTFTITAMSLIFALLLLLPLCWKRFFELFRILSVKEYLFMAVQALCGIFLFRMFLLIGLHDTSTGEAGILTGATPAITALLAMVLLKERANGKKLIGILSTVGGIILIQGMFTPGNSFSIEHFWGNLLVLCAAACESLFNLFSRIFAIKTLQDERHTVHPLLQTTVVSAIALLICVIPAMFEHPLRQLHEIGIKEWLALFWYGLFVTALAFILWYAGIKRCSAFTAAAFSGMMPFTSLLLSVMVLGERSSWLQWSGGFLIVGGMVLIGIGNVVDEKNILHHKEMIKKGAVPE